MKITVFKNLLRRFLAFVLVYSGFTWLRYVLRGHHRNSIRIVCYHSISEEERQIFERHIRYYTDRYDVISMTDAVDIINSDRTDYGRCLVITFDDSFKDNYEVAAPILRKYSIPACFFVVAHFVSLEEKDKGKLEHFAKDVFYTGEVKRNMGWAEVGKLSQSGFEIGSHTNTHPFLTKLPIEEAKRELFESKEMIERQIGQRIQHFAFPYGAAADFNYRLKELVKELGYASCSSTIKGFNSYNSDPFHLHRNAILPGWPVFMVKCYVHGGFDWAEALKRYLSHSRLIFWNSTSRGKEASYAQG